MSSSYFDKKNIKMGFAFLEVSILKQESPESTRASCEDIESSTKDKITPSTSPFLEVRNYSWQNNNFFIDPAMRGFSMGNSKKLLTSEISLNLK